jgi:hypothetical protein
MTTALIRLKAKRCGATTLDKYNGKPDTNRYCARSAVCQVEYFTGVKMYLCRAHINRLHELTAEFGAIVWKKNLDLPRQIGTSV